MPQTRTRTRTIFSELDSRLKTLVEAETGGIVRFEDDPLNAVLQHVGHFGESGKFVLYGVSSATAEEYSAAGHSMRDALRVSIIGVKKFPAGSNTKLSEVYGDLDDLIDDIFEGLHPQWSNFRVQDFSFKSIGFVTDRPLPRQRGWTAREMIYDIQR